MSKEKAPLKPAKRIFFNADAEITVDEDCLSAYEERGLSAESELEDCEIPVDIDGIRYMIRLCNVSRND